MRCRCRFFSSSIGKKTLMAITGLLLIGFLITHLAGNFLLFDFLGGREAYNEYSHLLTSSPLIYVAEVILLFLLIFHMASAVCVTIKNKKARPESYAKRNNLGESTFASRTMFHTGVIIFLFLVLHLVTFKFGEKYYTLRSEVVGKSKSCGSKKDVGGCFSIGGFQKGSSKGFVGIYKTDEKGRVIRDIYRTVMECFSKPWYSVIYIICILVLGLHLSHGMSSAFQTLGINHPRYTPMINKICCLVVILITLGYLIFPIYFGFIKGVSLCH